MTQSAYTHIKAGIRPDISPTIHFRSAWEANLARYLNTLVESGDILGWECEPVTFWFNKIKRGTRSYKPDFRITRLDSSQYYLELKGFTDARSKTKLNRMRIYNPTVEVQLMDQNAYRALEKQVAASIPGWETRVRKLKSAAPLHP